MAVKTDKRAMEIRQRPVAELIPYARNARTHSEAQVAQIAGSIRAFGFNNPVLVDEANGIIAGHGRVLAASQLGLGTVPVIELGHLDETQKRAYILADNRLAEQAGWDRELLSLELADLDALGIDLPGTAQCAEQVLSCKYGIPTTHWEVDAWAQARDGHRSPDMIAGMYACLDMSALDARANLLLRDHRLERAHPFVARSDDAIFSRRKTRLIRACNLFAGILQIPMPTVGEDFEWVTVTGNDAAPFSGPVWSMDVEKDQHYVADGLVTHNCWYAVRGKGHWSGDRTQSTLWQIPSRDQDAETVHGTQKPVECMRRPMLNNSCPGQAVYEPFCGSGTSIIAAETCGRLCFAMELDPAYVDVAVQRWQAFTGEAARLAGEGRSYDEVAADRAEVAA
ncbi:site-specific DNA-methyltransferase [Seohaeicola saemankumensis]|nr:ParB/Srx family N-terminal domain-containing protein [Seohaeicola saemankumensis]MCA0871455.1 site-specific DNA-methyltransferase [Seohaeicola saemankumensis]